MHQAVSNGSYDIAKIRADFPALSNCVTVTIDRESGFGKGAVYTVVSRAPRTCFIAASNRDLRTAVASAARACARPTCTRSTGSWTSWTGKSSSTRSASRRATRPASSV